MDASHQLSHPLHLLDDLLASFPRTEINTAAGQNNAEEPSPNNNAVAAAGASMAMAEASQDIVLRAACELLGNNSMSLLENALALLDEQKQYENGLGAMTTEIMDTNHHRRQTETNAPMTIMPVIRKIRARRSGREAILVRKQRKKASSTKTNKPEVSRDNDASSSQMGADTNDKNGRKQSIMVGDYYVCILGRDGIDRCATYSNIRRGARVRRRGAHCTCRSFFQNMKGGNSRSSSTSKSSNEVSVPSYSNHVIVCKHLLAAILMPHLLPWSQNGGIDDEVLDDREFAKLIMRASIG
mmetsp:Transcript_30982/g.52953  ORF Transcript_30982/g.52953 Transcript_30982/m.52953 type:complete len:298 (-) Transcript_30982:164-1057(-)